MTDANSPDREPAPTLKRNLGLTLMTLYGLGTILGAGIYVLTGVVVAEAGKFAPLSFVLAAMVALPTAYSYGVLTSRYPRSAGAAAYVDAAFKRGWLTMLMGALVVTVGIVSAATITRGFVGYLDLFVDLPPSLVICVLVSALTALGIYGVLESVSAAAVIAVIEIAGLLLIIVGGFLHPGYEPVEIIPVAEIGYWPGVLAGAFFAFYAFVGFEDIVTMAEETREPRKTLPLAIIGSLGAATLLYFMVVYVAVSTVPISELAGAPAPMALVVEKHGIVDPMVISVVAMLAVLNGALVQIIMASRVIYGVARMRSGPAWLSAVNPLTRTPANATLVVGSAILLLALLLDLRALATLTSAITLLIFLVINLALCRLQWPRFTVTGLIPWLAVLLSALLFLMSFRLS